MERAGLRLPPSIHDALDTYERALRDRFGVRLQRYALFGSWARGEQREHSDVDVLVVIGGATRAEQDEAVGLVADVDLATGVWLTPKVFSSERFDELKAMESPFVRAVLQEALTR